jgi:type IV pilus assembly protein PilC
MEKIVVRYADGQGVTHEETFEAQSREALRQSLVSRGYFILNEQKLSLSFVDKLKEGLTFQKAVTLKELNDFTKMLKTLIKSGVSIVEGIEILLEDAEDSALNRALRIIVSDIKAGSSLSQALARHSNVFPNIYIKTVVAGERAGALEAILDRLVDYFNNMAAIRKKVRGAMVYPAILLVVATLATSYMVVAVVPQFKDLFDGVGAELPLPTQILLGASEFMGSWGLLLLSLLILFVAIAISYVKSKEGKEQIDLLKLRIPVLKKLERNVAYSQFSRTLSTMLAGGIPLFDSLEVVLGSMENRMVAKELSMIPAELQRGNALAKTLVAIPQTPKIMQKIVKVGEESGNLSEMLDNLADHFDDETTELTSALVAMIEPVLFVGMAIVIGGIIIALLYPVLTAASQFN